MSVRVPTGPTGALGGVGIRAAVLVLVAAVAAGALAAYAPVTGVLLAVALVGVMLVRGRTLPELGRAAVLVALVTAIIGPNLGVPGRAEVFAFRLVAVLIILGIATWLLLLGAYAAGLLFKRAGLPMEAALLVAPLCAGAFAVVYGWFCVRLSGVYLAMLTLAFAQISWSISWSDRT